MQHTNGHTELDVTDCEIIGRNEHGYRFAVGLLGKLWIGFAVGQHGDGQESRFVFAEISDDGMQCGVKDRELAIRMTGAIAEDPCGGYGGISTWLVEQRLRGKPDEFRCANCSQVGCRGQCGAESFDAYDDGAF